MTDEEAELILKERIMSAKKTKKVITDREVESILIKKVSNVLTPTIKKVTKPKQLVEPTDKKIKKESEDNEGKNEGQFVQIPFSIFRDKEMYKEIAECIPLYSYLQSCIYRGEHGADKYKLYEKCYKCGILAASESIDDLAYIHNCCDKVIRRQKHLLEKNGIIKVISKNIIIKNRVGKKTIAKPYIYILGYTKAIMKDGEVKRVPVYDVSGIDVSKIVIWLLLQGLSL